MITYTPTRPFVVRCNEHVGGARRTERLWIAAVDVLHVSVRRAIVFLRDERNAQVIAEPRRGRQPARAAEQPWLQDDLKRQDRRYYYFIAGDDGTLKRALPSML